MGSIRLVKGSDDVLREGAVVDLVDALVGDGDRGLLVDEHAGADYELAAVVDAANTLPFLTDRRIVVARHLGRFPNADALRPLLDHLAAPLDTTDLVLVWERSPEPASRLGNVPPTLTKALKAAGGEVVEADAPGKNREAWIIEQMASHGVTLDRGAASPRRRPDGRERRGGGRAGRRLVGVHGPDARLGAEEVRPWLGEAGGVPAWELTDAIDKGDAAEGPRPPAPHAPRRRPPPAPGDGHPPEPLRPDAAPRRGRRPQREGGRRPAGHAGLDVPGQEGPRTSPGPSARAASGGRSPCWPRPTWTCGGRRPGPTSW